VWEHAAAVEQFFMGLRMPGPAAASMVVYYQMATCNSVEDIERLKARHLLTRVVCCSVV
jgi:hypothetical protein